MLEEDFLKSIDVKTTFNLIDFHSMDKKTQNKPWVIFHSMFSFVPQRKEVTLTEYSLFDELSFKLIVSHGDPTTKNTSPVYTI